MSQSKLESDRWHGWITRLARNSYARLSIVTLLLLILSVILIQAAPAPARNLRRPNIIVILAQDLAMSDLSCYGQTNYLTPNLDRLAATGMRFTNFYCGSPISVPSRATLLTGLHTGHSAVRGHEAALLTRQDVTIAEVIKRYGYRTGAIGLWGLGSPGTTGTPPRKGFDDWLGFLNEDHARQLYPEYLWRNEKRLVIADNVSGPRSASCQDLFARAALNFVKMHRDQPFLLYLAYTLPGRFATETNQTSSLSDYSVPLPQDGLTPQARRISLIQRVDQDVGRLLSSLDEQGLRSQTVIFFSSDRGSAEDEYWAAHPSSQQKQPVILPENLKETSLKVPMLVSWPGLIPPGRVSGYPWAFWDLLPTIADIGQTTRPEDLDGVSVVPTLLGKVQPEHEYFYWELPGTNFQQALRKDNWKAIASTNSATGELYNLRLDPGEKTNVFTQNPEVWEQLAARMKKAHSRPTTPSL
jgi:arylsulfatase A-like enzyme